MRVISGTAKGHKLVAPEGKDTRPTTDRNKESLFNMIAPDLYDAVFLDLFCGSGAIGIEALSRGAKKAVFVDSSRQSRESTQRNLQHTKLEQKAELLNQDVFSAIRLLKNRNERFDIIFMDPPYEEGLVAPVLEAIVLSSLLREDGYVIVERGAKTLPPKVQGLKIIREKDYKTTVMTFMVLEA